MTRLLLLISFIFSITTTSFASPTLSFTAGNDRSYYSSPFLVQTIDQGQSWSLQNIPDLPNAGFFQTSACSELMCIAAGNNYDYAHLLIQTLDGGKNWQPISLPGEFTSSTFYGSSCSNDICIAVGVTNKGAFLAQTTDRGTTWSLVDLNEVTKGYLLSAKCTDDYCVAVGHENGQPIIIQTEDKGQHWDRIEFANHSRAGVLNAVDCNMHYCVAVGSTKISSAPFNIHSHPIIIESDITKFHWKKQSFDDKKFAGTFSAVHCEKTKCIAVGNNAEKYFIAEKSLSQSWHLSKMPADHAGWLADVDCNDQHCFAVGYVYYNAKKILLSDRKGYWNPDIFPTDAFPGKLNTINCHEDFCFAAGESEGSPLLLQLKNDSWEKINIENIMMNGEFITASSGF